MGQKKASSKKVVLSNLHRNQKHIPERGFTVYLILKIESMLGSNTLR
jgi:hypothetical protein